MDILLFFFLILMIDKQQLQKRKRPLLLKKYAATVHQKTLQREFSGRQQDQSLWPLGYEWQRD
jgi:hypothetical protein